MNETRRFDDILFRILDETFEDPPMPSEGNAYLDPRTGWSRTLAALTAEQASRPLVPGGSTIAGHVRHTLYYIGVHEDLLRGEGPSPDWPASFRPGEVTDAEWVKLVSHLQERYVHFREAIRATEARDEAVGEALAVLAHSAYHLGAVRQMATVVRGGAPAG